MGIGPQVSTPDVVVVTSAAVVGGAVVGGAVVVVVVVGAVVVVVVVMGQGYLIPGRTSRQRGGKRKSKHLM